MVKNDNDSNFSLYDSIKSFGEIGDKSDKDEEKKK